MSVDFASIDFLESIPSIYIFATVLIILPGLHNVLIQTIQRIGNVSKQYVHIILAELNFLGMLSFSLFLLQYNFDSLNETENQVLFTFFHFVFLAFYVIYVCLIGLFSLERRFYSSEMMDFDDLIRTNQSFRVNRKSLCFAALKKQRFRRYSGMRKRFLHYNSLPIEFPYHLYMRDIMNYEFLKIIKLRWRLGFVIFLWVSIVYIFQLCLPRSQINIGNEHISYATKFLAYIIFGTFIFLRLLNSRIERNVIIDPQPIPPRDEHSLEFLEHRKTFRRTRCTLEDLFDEQPRVKEIESYRSKALYSVKSYFQSIFPCCFCADRHNSWFPCCNPNFFPFFLQFSLIYLSIYLVEWKLIYANIKVPTLSSDIESFVLPFIFVLSLYGALPSYCFIRHSGPFTQKRLMYWYLNLLYMRLLPEKYYQGTLSHKLEFEMNQVARQSTDDDLEKKQD